MTLSIQIVQAPSSEVLAKREFYLTDSKVVIGRDYSADINLPDASGEMSRSHLRLEQQDNGDYIVTDTSSNGTELNGSAMSSGAAEALADGDMIAFAGYKLLIGIIGGGKTDATAGEAVRKEPVFNVETDFTAEAPLMPDAEIEELPREKERGFVEGGLDLDQDLMFDPFADGPELHEEILPEVPGPTGRMPGEFGSGGQEFGGPGFDGSGAGGPIPDGLMPDEPRMEFSNIVPAADMMVRSPGLADLIESSHQAVLYREKVMQAAELALDKFLDEVDPRILQPDYDEFLPRFRRNRSRYWQIHLRQFAKRKSNGGFRRNFMAHLVEELRKI